MSYRVVHYINQFFANIGGEEMAHIAPELRLSIRHGRARLKS